MSAVLEQPAELLPDFDVNPYATYALWREAAPIVWSDAFFGGAWLLTRHADVEAALRDPRLSAQRTGGWVRSSACLRGRCCSSTSPSTRACARC